MIGSIKSSLTPFALLFVLAGCTYNSMVDAQRACNEWAQNGIKYQFKGYRQEHPSGVNCVGVDTRCWAEEISVPHVYEEINRWCNLEEETRQYLGWEDLEINSENILLEKQKLIFKNKKIKHYFRY
jgi:hypothetical protein